MAALNLSRFGKRSNLRRKAVWRSDGFTGPVYFSPSDDTQNTGGGGVLNTTGEPIDTIPLDAVIDEALRELGTRTIRLLKLDCEGSEYPILLTSQRLDAVQEVCGEYHEPIPINDATSVGGRTHYDRWVLKECLERAGFRVTLKPHATSDKMGLFFGKRQ